MSGCFLCPLPPQGWWCSREQGHEGPCAARRFLGEAARKSNGPTDTEKTFVLMQENEAPGLKSACEPFTRITVPMGFYARTPWVKLSRWERIKNFWARVRFHWPITWSEGP